MDKLFTVIILHYNQDAYWRIAVRSVLNQDYPAIQLIFGDDGSGGFNKSDVLEFVEGFGKRNIKSITVYSNEQNVGTVKNINKAHQFVQGEYILHLAADDCLCDARVLSVLADALEKKQPDILGVYGRCLMCDDRLNYVGKDFSSLDDMKKSNGSDARHQFISLMEKCVYHIGAMAFIYKELEEELPFSEQYYLHEDWPFFLKAARKGKRFWFVDAPTLLYRSGGVSRPPTSDLTLSRALLLKDYLILHEKEIFPYIRYLTKAQLAEKILLYDNMRAEAQPVLDFMLIKRIRLLKADWRFGLVIWEGLSEQQRLLFTGSLLLVLYTVTNILLCVCLGIGRHFFIAAVLIAFNICLLVLLGNCHYRDIESEYEKIKYYLFSPYR